MLRLLQDLVRDLVNPTVGADPDESLWSPSGWSEAATGPSVEHAELGAAPMAVNTDGTAAEHQTA